MRWYIFLMLISFLFQSAGKGQNYKIGVPFITNFTEKDFTVSNENWDIVQDERGVIPHPQGRISRVRHARSRGTGL